MIENLYKNTDIGLVTQLSLYFKNTKVQVGKTLRNSFLYNTVDNGWIK